jgi:hypothetical protein
VYINPVGGFTGNVALSAALTSSPVGAVDLPTFSFGTTTPVVITDANSVIATLTINTTAPSFGAVVYPTRPGDVRYAAGGSVLAFVLFLWIPKRHRNWQRVIGLLMMLLAIMSGVLACGSGINSSAGSGGSGGGGNGGGGGGTSDPGTTTGVYVITVTGTSGSITQTATLTVTLD